MESLVGTPSVKFIDKLKNLVFCFAILFLWVNGIIAFLKVLDTPFQFTPQLSFFLSCIITPIAEEIFYRGAPITIAKVINPDLVKPTVIFTSLWFGYDHGHGSISILIQGVGGFVLAWLYLKNQSIVWPILCHAMWNTYSMFLK
jgi:membrane protease YdiL (CAAX protease family)